MVQKTPPKNYNSSISSSSPKIDIDSLHKDPVSQVTQASQVLNHVLIWNYQKIPEEKIYNCYLKFIDREKEENDHDYEPIFGLGKHADKKHAKMKAAEIVLKQVTEKYGDWKEIQEKNKKEKKKKYQSEYRVRKDEEKRKKYEEELKNGESRDRSPHRRRSYESDSSRSRTSSYSSRTSSSYRSRR